jgi:multimeric flavodoxin WrbA
MANAPRKVGQKRSTPNARGRNQNGTGTATGQNWTTQQRRDLKALARDFPKMEKFFTTHGPIIGQLEGLMGSGTQKRGGTGTRTQAKTGTRRQQSNTQRQAANG